MSSIAKEKYKINQTAVVQVGRDKCKYCLVCICEWTSVIYLVLVITCNVYCVDSFHRPLVY